MSILTKRFKMVTLLAVFSLALGAGLGLSQATATAAPQLSHANLPDIVANHLKLPAQVPSKCNQGFLGLRPWYHYMDGNIDKGCNVICFNIFNQNEENNCHKKNSDIPGVLLALIDDALRIAGLVAVGFVFVGAFQYIESRGNSERSAQAQSTIGNALAGLIVALVAVAFISFLGHRLGG